MSYVSWHIYGYGIIVSDLKKVTYERVEQLIHKAPKYEEGYKTWLSENGITNPSLDELIEFDEDFGLGLATTLQEVILEAEGIELTACIDYEDKTYLLYEPTYPWNLKETEIRFTEEFIRSLLIKYVSIITDEQITVDYEGAENGG